MFPVDVESLSHRYPLQGRRTRLDPFDHSVSAPTNDHLDQLTLASFADYVDSLMSQKSSGAHDPNQREIALRTAKEKVVQELKRRIL